IPLSRHRLGELSLVPSEMPNGTAKFDLVLEFAPDGDALSGRLEYSTELFDSTTMDRLVCQLATLLTAAVAAPDAALSTLPVLDQAERHQLLVEWNATDQTFDDRTCV